MSRSCISVYGCWPPEEHPCAFSLVTAIRNHTQTSGFHERGLPSPHSSARTVPGWFWCCLVFALGHEPKPGEPNHKPPIDFMVLYPSMLSASKLLSSTLNGELWLIFFSSKASNICELVLPKFPLDFQISRETPEALQGKKGHKSTPFPCGFAGIPPRAGTEWPEKLHVALGVITKVPSGSVLLLLNVFLLVLNTLCPDSWGY